MRLEDVLYYCKSNYKKIKRVLLVLVNGVWTNASPLFTLKCKEQCSKNFCHTIASNQPSNKSLVGSSNSKIKIAGFICLTLQSLKKKRLSDTGDSDAQYSLKIRSLVKKTADILSRQYTTYPFCIPHPHSLPLISHSHLFNQNYQNTFHMQSPLHILANRKYI